MGVVDAMFVFAFDKLCDEISVSESNEGRSVQPICKAFERKVDIVKNQSLLFIVTQ